jgi:hypothetical protein
MKLFAVPSRFPVGKPGTIVFAAKSLPPADPTHGADICKAAGCCLAALFAVTPFKDVRRNGFIHLAIRIAEIVHTHLLSIGEIAVFDAHGFAPVPMDAS